MAASTPTLASSPAGASASPLPERGARRLRVVRLGLAGLSVLAVLVFAVYAAYLASQADDIAPPVAVTVPGQAPELPFGAGQRAPDFALTDLNGSPVRLSDFAGRPVWINVWASWCAPCRAEMPDIAAVYQDVQAAGAQRGDTGSLALLMVSLGEDPAVVRRYLDSTHYQLPILLDPDFAFTDHYRVTGLPTHYFVGRDGVIRDLAIGGLKPNAIRSRLAKIL